MSAILIPANQYRLCLGGEPSERLLADVVHMQAASAWRPCQARDIVVKPASYTGTGAGLLLPPPGSHARPLRAGKICSYPGWLKTAYLQSSRSRPTFLRWCG
jgi:hypothetical protein